MQSKFINLILVIVSILSSLLAGEFFLRSSHLTDILGWTRNETVTERIARIDKKLPNEFRILGLGDSFSDYRDSDGLNYLRFIEKYAVKTGSPLNVVNLSEEGTVSHLYWHRGAGSEPVFILIPDSIVVAKRYHSFYERLGFHIDDSIHNVYPVPLLERIKSHLNSNHYKHIDLLPVMRRKNDNLYIPMDIHFNNAGQKVAGEAVFKELVKFGLVKLESKLK